jgi:aminoglycoside 3-N-acetyltransferase I
MITLQRLSKTDTAAFREMVLLFKDVFEMKSTAKLSDAYIKKLLAKPEFIALAVFDGTKIVGALTAYEMPQYYGEYAEVYIYDMAVHTSHQRKGIGKKLIASLKGYCRANGIKTMFVEAHADDKHAVKFYLSTKGKAERVVHFNYNI